jgi:hypothetical protein
MRKLLVIPKALAVTLFACGSPQPMNDGGIDGGTRDGGTDAGTDAGFDDGGADAGCDCRGACPQVDCAAFQELDGGMVCECSV